MTDEYAARAVAFFLPQFHPIPENDEWWGAGFTEWTNAAKARPLFPGHRQPTLPADLGFYDLRVPETREAQAELAEQYGVEAFCYWHYWFGAGDGSSRRPSARCSRAADRPSPSASPGPTRPGPASGTAPPTACSWSRPIRVRRTTRPTSTRSCAAFRDERYLRVDGRAVFYVFRPEELPDAAAFVDRWQEMARKAGLEGLYLVAEASDLLGRGPKYVDGKRDGFDASVYMRLPVRTEPSDVLRCAPGASCSAVSRSTPTPRADPAAGPRRPVVLPAVRLSELGQHAAVGRRGLVLQGATPERFRPHVRAAVESLASKPAEERLLWVKSWNEWAEGNHLEPDLRFGHGWLQVLREELRRG